MSNNYEAKLYRTLANVNDLTKSNVTTNLMNAVSSGSLAIDEYLLKQVITVVNSTIDQTVDVAHTQVLRINNEPTTATKKKPVGRKTTK